jgi:catechol 2,3-dioxygenase-like lactoylglutathione lyase family enzyme
MDAWIGSQAMEERAVPILPSRDLEETLAFYARLGFELRGAPIGEVPIPNHRARLDRTPLLGGSGR